MDREGYGGPDNSGSIDGSQQPVQPYAAGQFVQPTAQPVQPNAQPGQPPAQTPAPVQPGQYGQPQVTLGYYGQPNPYANIAPVLMPVAPKKSKKKYVVAALATFVVIAGIAGGVLGLYIPNRPQNVWRTGMDRTGEVVVLLTDQAASAETREAFSASQLEGSFAATAGEAEYSGTLASSYDKAASKSKITLTIKESGTKAKKASVEAFSKKSKDGQYPDVFFKVTGMSDLGLDDYVPGLVHYENKWISITSKYLESMVPAAEQPEQRKDSFQQEDAAELARIAAEVSRQYVFTPDANKSVLVQKRFVGAEKLPDGTANRYEVGLSKANAVQYCKALSEHLIESEAYRKIPGVSSENMEDDKKEAQESCDKDVADAINENDSFDIWIDKKYKLVRKVRVHDSEEKKNYIEFGQSYKGGDEVPLYLVLHEDEDSRDVRVDLVLNNATKGAKGNIVLKGEGDEPFDAKISLEAKPHLGGIKVTPPKDAVPLEEVLRDANIDPAYLYSLPLGSAGAQQKAKDTERVTDIRAIKAQLEAVYAREGYYPSLTQLNDPAWRASKMRGLDNEALRDPDGSNYSLFTTASATKYGYSPDHCSQPKKKGCQSYSLSAMKSDGTTYIEKSLNFVES